MPFVLDASTALNLILSEGATPAGVAVEHAFTEGDSAQVPGLWLLEVANALLMAERRHRIGPATGDRLMGKLLALPIQIAHDISDSAARMAELLELARTHHLTAYDAAYLWLARKQDLPIATSDRALTRAAKALSIPLVGN